MKALSGNKKGRPRATEVITRINHKIDNLFWKKLTKSNSDNIFMILTHCDKDPPSEDFILSKLASFNSIMKN
jgi:hypothetical protein